MPTIRSKPTHHPLWKHILSDINTEERTATCAHCGPNADVRWRQAAEKWVCLSSRRESKTKNGVNNRYWKRAREAFVLEQGGKCAICGRSDEDLVLDHCHKTNLRRAALCRGCNTGIGHLREDPEVMRAAAIYIEKHRDKKRKSS